MKSENAMTSFISKYKEACISAATLAAALLFEHTISFSGSYFIYLPLYGISYLSVGGPVWFKAYESLKKGNLFSEFFLMGIATLGALALGEYAEGVAVMLFYMIGEYTQSGAVQKARGSIKSLIDQQPDAAMVELNGTVIEKHPSQVVLGEIIRVRPGEKVPLDGKLLNEKASFNTAALTGESKPRTIEKDEEVWAGSINRETPARIEVTHAYQDTRLANILNLVQEAARRKAPTQRFISRFAKKYTPAVVWLAMGVTFLPYFFVENYVFQDWFYKALIFLVVSCPCGLVISIPLGYFGGIGAASQNGILFKGSDYLDQLRKMKTLFLDKTGTLTEGSFKVQEVKTFNGLSEADIVRYAGSLEKQSTHPIGKAILDYNKGFSLYTVQEQEEISGKGLTGKVEDETVLVGNKTLLEEYHVKVQEEKFTGQGTIVHVAVAGEHAGTILISDQLREDSERAIAGLRKRGVNRLIMLSGDNEQLVKHIGEKLGMDEAFGGLLPGDKYRKVEEALGHDRVVGFVGDGVNDAPVITLADVGMAMGGMGSDASIETADVVIQTDQPSKICTAIDISRFTNRVVWQNIVFALGIKVLVMIMAAFGIATMWEAIFADVGVALIAILNAIRIQKNFTPGLSWLNFFQLKDSGRQLEPEQDQACCDNCC